MSCREAEIRSRVLIIGYGNTLRGDDGLGVVVAQRLGSRLNGSTVDVIWSHQLLPEMAEALSRCKLAIFIDACCDRLPGRIGCRRVVPAIDHALDAHRSDPAGLGLLALRLFGACPKILVVTIGGEDFGCTEALSPKVANTVETLVPRLARLVLRHLGRLANA